MRRAAALLALSVLGAAGPVDAVQTRTWTEGAQELHAGEFEGVAVSRRGRLSLAPALDRIAGDGLGTGAAHVWSAVLGRGGALYLGTGPDGAIVRVDASGATRTVATLPEPMVTALAVLPDGDLLAGTAPGGRIVRVRASGAVEPFAETGQRYVWSLALGEDGAVYAGTGDGGIVFRVSPGGQVEPFFDADDSHVVALTSQPGGALLAGTGGRGLIERIEGRGRARVLHDDDLAEVREVVAMPDGSLVAAVLARTGSEPRPPAVRIRVPQTTAPGAATETPTFDSEPGPVIEGVIEGLPPSGLEEMRGGARGRIVRVDRDGTATQLWESSLEAPYALALDGSGRLLFGTGEPGRLYRLDEDGEPSLLATLAEGQITCLVPHGQVVLVATSNPAAVHRVAGTRSDGGVYTSRAYDAGGVARWGRIRWRAAGSEERLEISTRTGNSEIPDGTWAPWSAAVREADGARVTSPDGRFLQWRLRILPGEAAAPEASSVAVTFVPHNRPPSLREFRLDKPASPWVSGEASFRWLASDPDGDPVAVKLQVRPIGTTSWQTAVSTTASDPDAAAAPEPEEMRKDGRLVWDTTTVAEGSWEVRGVASDQMSNTPGAGREAFSDALLAIHVDRTPPQVELRPAGDDAIEVTIVDGVSVASRLEIVQGGHVVSVAPPVDGVSDSRRETYRVARANGQPGEWLLRAFDAAGNVVERPLDPR